MRRLSPLWPALACVFAVLSGCRPGAAPGVGPTPGTPQQHAHAAGEGATGAAAETKKTPHEVAGPQVKALSSLAEGIAFLKGEEAEEAVQELAQAALDESLPIQARETAIHGLGAALGKHEKARRVLAKLAEDRDPAVRTAVAQAGEAALTDPFAQQLLARLAKDTDPGVRAVAIDVRSHMLAAQQSAAAVEALIAQLGNPEADASAKAALQLIIKGGDQPQAVLPHLTKAFSASHNPRQREAITMCIALICAGTNPQQEKFGRLAMATRKVAVRLHPARLEGVPPLLLALRDPDPGVREIAAQGLGYLGDPSTAPALGRALSDPEVGVRRRAAAALVTVPAKGAQKALEHAARHDPDPTVRRYAVEALGWIEDDSVVPALIAATRDPQARVRRYAAMELGRRKATRALDALLSLFDDPDPDVRWQATLAVGELRDKRAIDALVKALDDPAPQVANAAERALQRLGIARRKETHLEAPTPPRQPTAR
jgi:HEAT repeat protein